MTFRRKLDSVYCAINCYKIFGQVCTTFHLHAWFQANTPGVGGSSLTLQELQTWITACRSFLKTNMGSFLLKSGVDDSLLLGDLHIVVSSLHGLTSPASKFTVGHLFSAHPSAQLGQDPCNIDLE